MGGALAGAGTCRRGGARPHPHVCGLLLAAAAQPRWLRPPLAAPASRAPAASVVASLALAMAFVPRGGGSTRPASGRGLGADGRARPASGRGLGRCGAGCRCCRRGRVERRRSRSRWLWRWRRHGRAEERRAVGGAPSGNFFTPRLKNSPVASRVTKKMPRVEISEGDENASGFHAPYIRAQGWMISRPSAPDRSTDPCHGASVLHRCSHSHGSRPHPSSHIGGIPIMTRAQRFHPLDPLSAAEIAVAVATVRAAGKSPEERDSMRFVEAVLLEPEKNVVALADAYFFPPFQPSLLPRTKGSAVIPSRLPPRRAKLVVYNRHSNETTIWIVELSEVHAATRGGHHRGKVISSEVVPDVQPAMDAMEYAECEATVKNYPPFVEAMKKRGVDDMELVMVDAWCAGYYSDADAPSRRLARPLIFCRTESDSPMENGYARPVEGIHVVVDMQNNIVIEFEDRKFVPLPPPDHLRNYTPGETRGGVDRSDVKPLIINQPEGPSFRINGYFVEWQKWNFRIGFTPKEGLVIYSVAYVDGSRGRRPIAHRLSFVEMVVPYGDPSEPHYRKNAFDAGEDGLGKNAHSLKKGCDCLGYIKYFDAHFTNFTGHVETIENCVCLHEEDHGILWKHQDWRTGLAEVRRSRRLTVSFICTVANYEYGFYWHFYQDGKIEAEVKLTGILSLGALMPGESRKYGTTIAPSLYAPVHQHFFVARMDMAIDCKPNEAHNQVVEVNVKVESAGTNNVHNNAFYAEEKILKSELQAMRDCDPSSARHWIVRNTRAVNRTGQPTGFRLVPGSNCLPFALPEAKFLRRAGFLKHNLWVTPYKSDEKFPGGEFPNQNPRLHEGLATWVKKDRPLEETDIVLWYVFGLTHIPRLEDWPVMPVEHIGFMLMPHGFFNCSPAVDVPPGTSDAADVKEAESPKAIQNGALVSKL